MLQGGKKSNGSSDCTEGLDRQRTVTELFPLRLMSWLSVESLAALWDSYRISMKPQELILWYLSALQRPLTFGNLWGQPESNLRVFVRG